MKIGIVTETFLPDINGVALTTANLTENLVDLGHDVFVVKPQPEQTSENSRYRSYQAPSLPLPKYDGLRFGLPARRQVNRIFQLERPDAIYVATEGPLGYVAIGAANKLGIPAMTGFHTRFDQYASHYRVSLLTPLVKRYLRHFHNRAAATLVPTREMQELLLGMGIQRPKILNRAVDNRAFSPRFRSLGLRLSWGLQEDDLAVLYVGRLAAEKNLGLAVQAFRAIQEEHANARFVIVGDGPERAQLQAENPDFIFCGMRSGADLSRHYASADLFLFPSLSETFGNVVLEALASGLPCVAYDCAAAGDFIRPGENGFLAQPSDADAFIRNARVLAQIATNLPDLRRNARVSVRHLDQSSVAASLAELFASTAPSNS